MEERRPALAQGHDLLRPAGRHQLVPAPDRARAARRVVLRERGLRVFREESAGATRRGADVEKRPDVMAGSALRAGEMRQKGENHRQIL